MSYLESEALCPYYQDDKFGILKCEIGNIKLRDPGMVKDVGYALCADKYQTCPFKAALDSYYERHECEATIIDEEEPEQISWF